MTQSNGSPIRSMTGFARVRRMTAQGELILSLRGVNHRGLDLHFHFSPDFEPFESAMRKAISARVIRGHIDVRLQVVRVRGSGKPNWNRDLMAAWVEAYRAASKEYSLIGQADINYALQLPGMLVDAAPVEPSPEMEATLIEALEEALAQFNQHRDSEGSHTAAVVAGHAAGIREAAGKIAAIRDTIMPALQSRLQERLEDLLGSAGIEPQRLAQEAALLAERSDIGEEVTRLGLHADRLLAMIEAGGEIGKKLEFLLQEMHREVNTILSKSNATGEPGRAVVELALAVKSEIEKIREQSQNLE
jgi:uncharacterized protein (TIGR00255 family)